MDVPAVTPTRIVDPTGVGDAFRGGLMRGISLGLPYEMCARMGSVAATYALEHMGGLSHAYTWDEFKARYQEHFGVLTLTGLRPGRRTRWPCLLDRPGDAAVLRVGWAIGVPLLVPILNTLASFPFMVLALKRGDLRLAVARMLLWALTMGVRATLLSYARPAQTDALFLRGEAYRTEMFAWVVTGQGAESTPSQFIPQQAGHAVLFSALALATGGVAAMPMGAVLMNYMGHYVGAGGRQPASGADDDPGWHPWAVIRVISFVMIGVVLSAPLLSRLGKFRVEAAARPLLLGRRRRPDRRHRAQDAAGAGLAAAAAALRDPIRRRHLLSSGEDTICDSTKTVSVSVPGCARSARSPRVRRRSPTPTPASTASGTPPPPRRSNARRS